MIPFKGLGGITLARRVTGNIPEAVKSLHAGNTAITISQIMTANSAQLWQHKEEILSPLGKPSANARHQEEIKSYTHKK